MWLSVEQWLLEESDYVVSLSKRPSKDGKISHSALWMPPFTVRQGEKSPSARHKFGGKSLTCALLGKNCCELGPTHGSWIRTHDNTHGYETHREYGSIL